MADIPYSNFQLEQLLKHVLNNKKLKIFELSHFYNRTVKSLFGENNYAVVYLEEPQPSLTRTPNNSSIPIGHWVVLIQTTENSVELFNSLGLQDNHNIKPILDFFKRKKIAVTQNKDRLQGKNSNVCGKYVLSRIYSRHKSITDYLKIFDNNVLTPDELVMTLISLQL